MDVQICRLCLARSSVHFCLKKNREISEMLQSITSLEILQGDDISTVICYKCNLNLKLAYKIQQNMLKAETRFYAQFQVKTEIIDEPIKVNNSDEVVEKNVPIKNNLKCDKCHRVYATKLQLRKHRNRIHNILEVPLKCVECQKSFQTRHKYAGHMYAVHSKSKNEKECVNNEEFECTTCNKKFATRKKLWYHSSRSHVTLSEPLKCPACHKTFANKMKLKEHTRIHTNNGPHPCDYCDQTFSSRTALRKHKVNHLRAQCPVCHKELGKTNMRQHMMQHGEKQICDICGHQSTTKYNLKVHKIRVHGNPTLHKCQYCEKTFTTRTSKNTHEKNLHLGEKTVQCEQCGRKFFNKVGLKNHIDLKHLNIVKSFKCEFCGKDYAKEYSLKMHKKIHTNETPFKCEICDDGFRQRVSLRNHLKSKHDIEEELTEFCKVCGRGFSSMVALQAHRRVHE